MTRHLFLAIALVGTAVLFNASAEAATPFRCEDRAANCVGRCANYTGGAGDLRGRQNVCMVSCDRRVISCLVRARY
jgi:hypothetical protein